MFSTLRSAILLILFFTISCANQNPPSDENSDPIRILYVTGGGFHDYEAQAEAIREGLSERLPVEITVDHEAGESNSHQLSRHNDPNWHEDFDAVIYNMCFALVTDTEYIESVTRPHYETGIAAIVLHCAMHTYRDADTEEWDRLLGLSTYHHERQQREFEILPLNTDHPAMADFPEEGWVSPRDELYIVTGVFDNMTPLAQAWGPETEAHHVVMWANEYGEARVIGATAGHNTDVISDPVYMDFLANGLRWATRR
ncbi:MAG: ThuA domain-containing protein [Balneolaceae bacterium]